MSKIIDMIGKKYGRLTVISKAERSSNGQTRHLCRCDCGNEKIYQSANIRNGTSLSCGCMRSEIISKRNKVIKCTHGMSATSEYKIWAGMLVRCSVDHPKNSSHFGRGIKVCKRWIKFENFIEDMGIRPSKVHSIDRIDNDGNYEPSNCRWATKSEQSNNTRRNVFVTYDGETKTLMQWSKSTGIVYETIVARFNNGLTGHVLFQTVPKDSKK